MKIYNPGFKHILKQKNFLRRFDLNDIDLKNVGLELMFLTPEKYAGDDGITAVELSKLVKLPVDIVKKKLSILKSKNIVRVKGNNPKFWLFDEYNLILY